MAEYIKPNLDILPPAQRQLWDEFKDIPPDFVLYGGTAIALQIGHRQSVDFDFFGSEGFDPDILYRSVPFLEGASVLQKAKDTLTALVDRGGPVHVSFFGVPRIVRIREPLVVRQTGLKIADLIDLAGMKAAVVQKRGEAKDYIDLDALSERAGIGLATALSAARHIYGPSFNPQITLKALCYFEDGNLETLPAAVRARLVEAVRAVDLDRLPRIEPFGGIAGPETGR
jgi:hypothetical protein